MKTLSEKIGPLPVWSWVVAIIGGVWLFRRVFAGSSSTSTTPATTDTTTPADGGPTVLIPPPAPAPVTPPAPTTNPAPPFAPPEPGAFVGAFDPVTHQQWHYDFASSSWLPGKPSGSPPPPRVSPGQATTGGAKGGGPIIRTRQPAAA